MIILEWFHAQASKVYFKILAMKLDAFQEAGLPEQSYLSASLPVILV